MSGPQSQSKCRCFPPNPPFRPGLADQTGSPLASRDVRAAVTQGPSETPPGKAFEYDSTTPESSSGPPVPRPTAVVAALSPRPRVPASNIGGFPVLDPGSCASLPALIFLTCPERDQLLRQRGADVTVYTHAPFGASRQTPGANDLPTSQNTICI